MNYILLIARLFVQFTGNQCEIWHRPTQAVLISGDKYGY